MKAILGILGIVILVVVVIMLIFSGDPEPQQPAGQRRVNLTDYTDTSAKAIYEIEGQINGEEQHRTIRISVDRNLRRIEVLRGYNYAVEKAQDFPNTQSAYDEFLHALKNAGFANSKETSIANEKGVCPLGQRFIYELEEFGDDLLRLWSTSCSRTDGSFAGNSRLVQQLFQKQIPEYRQFVSDVKLAT